MTAFIYLSIHLSICLFVLVAKSKRFFSPGSWWSASLGKWTRTPALSYGQYNSKYFQQLLRAHLEVRPRHGTEEQQDKQAESLYLPLKSPTVHETLPRWLQVLSSQRTMYENILRTPVYLLVIFFKKIGTIIAIIYCVFKTFVQQTVF